MESNYDTLGGMIPRNNWCLQAPIASPTSGKVSQPSVVVLQSELVRTYCTAML